MEFIKRQKKDFSRKHSIHETKLDHEKNITNRPTLPISLFTNNSSFHGLHGLAPQFPLGAKVGEKTLRIPLATLVIIIAM